MTRSDAGKLGAKKSKKFYENRRIELEEEYSLAPKKCKFCNSSLKYEKRKKDFCNRSCSTSFNNFGVNRHNSKVIIGKNGKKRFKTIKSCLNCNIEIISSKFCSQTCQHEFKRNERYKRIEAGDLNMDHRQIKSYLILTRGHKCEECKNIKWLNKEIPLELEHIDGNSNNNDLKNLKLLCPNCHTFTPTYKGRNKNSNRDRSRYYKRKNGK